jgi:hypothetical protein
MPFDIRTTDAKARLRLPKEFANSTVMIEQVSAGELRIRKARLIPEDELRFCEESVTPLSNGDRDLFLAMLTNPPKPNEALKKAIARHKARHGRLGR